LRAAEGPGIELLEYLAPRDGRPFPADEHSNDLVHRQTVLLASNSDELVHKSQQAHVPFVSSELVANPKGELGFRKAFVVRDPDGHAVEIEEK